MTDRFDIRALYDALNARRQIIGLDWRDLAKQADVNASTFSRMGVQGLAPNVENLARMLIWLGDTDIKPYLVPDGEIRPERPTWTVQPSQGGWVVVHPTKPSIGVIIHRAVADVVCRAMQTNESEVSQ